MKKYESFAKKIEHLENRYLANKNLNDNEITDYKKELSDFFTKYIPLNERGEWDRFFEKSDYGKKLKLLIYSKDLTEPFSLEFNYFNQMAHSIMDVVSNFGKCNKASDNLAKLMQGDFRDTLIKRVVSMEDLLNEGNNIISDILTMNLTDEGVKRGDNVFWIKKLIENNLEMFATKEERKSCKSNLIIGAVQLSFIAEANGFSFENELKRDGMLENLKQTARSQTIGFKESLNYIF